MTVAAQGGVRHPAHAEAGGGNVVAAVADPCQSCGICCASFRVDFAVEESQEEGGSVPEGLVVEVNARLRRMRGTDHSPPRCAALTGTLGERVACGIYEWRPSPCREFEAGSTACLQARTRKGLSNALIFD